MYKDWEKQKAAWRSYYHRSKELFKARRKASKAKLRAFVNKIKTGPCIDCKKKYPPEVMDLDHVRGGKRGHIASLVNSRMSKAVIEELKKCELVCANCHRIRTAKRRVQVSPS